MPPWLPPVAPAVPVPLAPAMPVWPPCRSLRLLAGSAALGQHVMKVGGLRQEGLCGESRFRAWAQRGGRRNRHGGMTAGERREGSGHWTAGASGFPKESVQALGDSMSQNAALKAFPT